MSSPAVLSNFLGSLPPRPPTPPREAHHEAAVPIKPSLGSIDTQLSLHTPPGHSPASSITTSTSHRIRKKVGFSAEAEYKDPPVYVDGEGVRQHPTPVSLSRSASKPVKSILKVTANAPNLLDPTAGSDCDPSNLQVNLAAMLESTLQQLAGGDRDSKLDAYLMLTRAWKASNNLPDRVALQEKMTLFTQFMQRDIVAKSPEGTLDTSLVNHALNLLNTFLHFPAIASTISNDFGIFLVDHCIRSFEDASVPKDTARRLMQAISLQNFSSKVMTPDRVGRLVSSLRNIEEHLKGKSIVLSRVLIYRKLVQQARQPMVSYSDWLLDMFTDMLSNVKDIRSAAISLGLEAAFSIGHEKSLSRKVMEVLNLSYEDRRYIEYYEAKLNAMAKNKHESAVVPEIWSIVLLLLRIRPEKWEFGKRWLHIIQNCFNSTDFPTKIAANHAWGRFVYLMLLESKALSAKNMSILTSPLISQLLRRKGSGRTSEELRQTVLGGICNLFYYAFKPNTSYDVLDGYWDSSLEHVLRKLLEPTAEAAEGNLCQVSAILSGLFDCTTPRRWRVDHIAETSVVRPDELPAIDPKWLRQNSNRVFAVVEPILEQDFFALAKLGSATHNLWQTLVTTVASAAAKEIKVSKDTSLFVAEALAVLQKLWSRGLTNKADATVSSADFLLSARAYLEIMTSSLGVLPFTEKTGKPHSCARPPLYTLFSMLSALPPDVPDDACFATFFREIFAPFFDSKGDKARMDLAQDLISVIPMDNPRPFGAWVLVAENIFCWLEPGHHSHQSTASAGETPVGHDYRDIVKVLERGLRSTPNLPYDEWESLFHACVKRVREETGDAGVAIVVIEPLAKVLAELFTAQDGVQRTLLCVRYVAELVSVATQPRDRQAVDAARKRLWGTVLAGSRSSSFDTFDNLYRLINEVLGFLYNHLNLVHHDDEFDFVNRDFTTAHLFKEISGFFDRCNSHLLLRAMVSVQDGCLPWFEDQERLLGSVPNPVLAATKSLWDKLSHLIASIEHPEQHLQFLERFFCASFASCHRAMVNGAISLWNRLFQNVGHLDYPEELRAALERLQLQADIILPGLEVSSAEYPAQQPAFIESFENFSLPRLPSTRSSSRIGTPRPSSSQAKSPASTRASWRHLDRSPQRKPAAANWRNTTPRLRHDDSQIQFAAIEPSSAMGSLLESQVLTERQKEIRDRQRENAALFPEIRSSPGIKSKVSGRQMESAGTRTRQDATPEPERGFDDYISSTPTPRRGQVVVIPEHDLTDPPSSPPELRGNPLAAEIRSRSASHSLMEEWQFSSSPVSGSPNPNRHEIVPDPSSKRGYVNVVTLPRAEDAGSEVPSSPAKAESRAESQSAVDEIIEDSMILEVVEVAPIPEPAEISKEIPSTPRRSSRLFQARSRETPTPKSDAEEFVDAPTSPLPPTPKKTERAAKPAESSKARPPFHIPTDNTSFEVSDLDEKSLIRLVVELDSVKTDRSEYYQPSPSVSPEGKGQGSPVIDCIVVGDSPQKPVPPAPPRLTRTSSAASAVSSSAEPEGIATSQSKTRPGRQKRKRASSKAQGTIPKKKRHDSSQDISGIPASQTATVDDVDVEVHASAEMPAIAAEGEQKEGNHEERIPSSSAEPSSLENQNHEDCSQYSVVPEAGDVMEVEEDDQGVQSQIALELNHSCLQEDDRRPNSEENPLESPPQEEVMQADSQQPTIDGEAEEGAADIAAGPVTSQEVAPVANRVQKILSLFRDGLDELRQAALSRQEVYQIEDMFMDIKRELYEAERRGRA
ncbi:hypothetical protein N657DRAFT_610143 [Parathielavia appendiculata]|uniref:Telomere-associated protein Rif1 N-terminal domain-containing protein n=1 Tax=Parathielavia appendiculata TaxID=2587402 RepID=A0AAN6Z944_9PEZI|nr:hypothetical protein N657DRAFT_610143 [Parathielavia appendiculata]